MAQKLETFHKKFETARIIRFAVAGRLGRASINRAKSGTFCVSPALTLPNGERVHRLEKLRTRSYLCIVGLAVEN